METKAFRPSFKALDEQTGTARFVVATLNEIDSDGDVTLPGFFGRQDVPMVPTHDWGHVPIGKGVLFEEGDEAIVEVKFNMAIQAAKDWHSAIAFDVANPPALQEYSYGYDVLSGGWRYGEHSGREVRYLIPQMDGSPGVKVLEVSPVLAGAGNSTRTLDVKSNINLKFADQARAVMAAVSALSDRAADVLAMRLEKGKGFGADSAALLQQVQAELKRLGDLVATPAPDPDELRREFLRFVAVTNA